MALRDLGADFEHYRVVEFDTFAMKSYNAIHGTDFQKTDIRNIGGSDLGITDTDKYCYIMTYSFPCQDLSVAGKQAGMKKGSGTRSELLWEVERLLNECENLPDVLLMENVPAVHSEKNMPDFQKWIDFLASKGYSNYWQDLNAKDYGVAQNRERCFMVSLLGEWNYKFPKPIPLTKTMKDYLEDEVDEKYYINTEKAQKLIDKLIENGTIDGERNCVDLSINEPKTREIGNCITSHVSKDGNAISNRKSVNNGVLEKKTCLLSHYAENYERETEIAGTIMARDYKGFGKQVGNGVIEYALNTMPDGTCRTIKSQYIKNSIDNFENQSSYGATGVIVSMRGRNPDNPSDRTEGSPTEQRLEPTSQGICNTITSIQKDNMVMERFVDLYNSRIREDELCGTITSNGNTSSTNCGTFGVIEKNANYRIRKLTPLEVWRLMDFSDEDFHKAESVNSNSQLYREAGNSICRNVLVAIFGQMIPGKEKVYMESEE